MNKPFLLLLGAIAISGGWAIVSADSAASASGQPDADSPLVLGIASSHHEPAPAIDIAPAAPAASPTPASAPAAPPIIPAAISMAQAREHGDDRAPPMAPRHGEDREPPTQAELDDPARYQQYSERQERRVYSAYVKAADGLLPQLDRDIARARAEGGITPEQIAKAEEKRRRIAEMQAELTEKLQANP